MLRKLLKYELRATGRIFLPFFGALLLLSIINRVFYSGRVSRAIDTLQANGKGLPLELIRILSMVAFIFIICAIFVLTVTVMLQRYYKNLLGDEGYLMFTLPVRPWQLITSKMLVACLWLVASMVVTLLACLLLALDVGNVASIFVRLPGEISGGEEVFHTLLLFVEGALAVLTYLCCFILLTYAAITIGQLWSAHKLLGAFGAFLALNIIQQTVTTFVVWVGNKFGSWLLDVIDLPPHWANEHMLAVIHSGIWIVILWGALMGAAFFIISNSLLGKKLNLE